MKSMISQYIVYAATAAAAVYIFGISLEKSFAAPPRTVPDPMGAVPSLDE